MIRSNKSAFASIFFSDPLPPILRSLMQPSRTSPLLSAASLSSSPLSRMHCTSCAFSSCSALRVASFTLSTSFIKRPSTSVKLLKSEWVELVCRRISFITVTMVEWYYAVTFSKRGYLVSRCSGLIKKLMRERDRASGTAIASCNGVKLLRRISDAPLLPPKTA